LFYGTKAVFNRWITRVEDGKEKQSPRKKVKIEEGDRPRTPRTTKISDGESSSTGSPSQEIAVTHLV
jgi:hypothetical protein